MKKRNRCFAASGLGVLVMALLTGCNGTASRSCDVLNFAGAPTKVRVRPAQVRPGEAILVRVTTDRPDPGRYVVTCSGRDAASAVIEPRESVFLEFRRVEDRNGRIGYASSFIIDTNPDFLGTATVRIHVAKAGAIKSGGSSVTTTITRRFDLHTPRPSPRGDPMPQHAPRPAGDEPDVGTNPGGVPVNVSVKPPERKAGGSFTAEVDMADGTMSEYVVTYTVLTGTMNAIKSPPDGGTVWLDTTTDWFPISTNKGYSGQFRVTLTLGNNSSTSNDFTINR